MQNSNADKLSELPRVANQENNDGIPEGKSPEPVKSDSFWGRVKWLKERGLWEGDYQEYTVEQHNLNKGEHYFVVEDRRKASIKCISCPVNHGGILEARLLSRYALKDGVLYLDEKPVNKIPDGFTPGD